MLNIEQLRDKPEHYAKAIMGILDFVPLSFEGDAVITIALDADMSVVNFEAHRDATAYIRNAIEELSRSIRIQAVGLLRTDLASLANSATEALRSTHTVIGKTATTFVSNCVVVE